MATHTFTITIDTPTDVEPEPLCEQLAYALRRSTGYDVSFGHVVGPDDLGAIVGLLNQRCDVQGESLGLAAEGVRQLTDHVRVILDRQRNVEVVQANQTQINQRILERIEQMERSISTDSLRLATIEHYLVEGLS